LFIQGEHDEFTSAAACADFVLSQDPLVHTELTLLPGEGHIFRSSSSWARASDNCAAFLRRSFKE
jgi:hypothetical protein